MRARSLSAPVCVCVRGGGGGVHGILLNWSEYISVYNKVKPMIFCCC